MSTCLRIVFSEEIRICLFPPICMEQFFHRAVQVVQCNVNVQCTYMYDLRISTIYTIYGFVYCIVYANDTKYL